LIQYFPILFATLIMVIKSDPENKAVTFIGSEAFKRKIERDLFKVNVTRIADIMPFGHLENHKSLLGDKVLTLTSLRHISSKIYFNDFSNIIVNCRDGQVSLDLGKNSGYLFYDAHAQLALMQDDKVVDKINTTIEFEINIQNVNIIKEYRQDNSTDNPLIARGEVRSKFVLRGEKTRSYDEKLNEHLSFINEGLEKILEKNSPSVTFDARVTDALNKYYKEEKEKFGDDVTRIQVNFDKSQTYDLKMDFISPGKPIVHEGACGLAFATSGYYKNPDIIQKGTQVDFADFDVKSDNGLYLDLSVFTDLLRDVTKEYNVKSIINEFKDLPYSMSMRYLNEVLPDVTKSFSLTDKIELHWALFEPSLEIKDVAFLKYIHGKARLDATVWKATRPMKQLMSFECDIKFNMMVESDKSGVNLIFDVVWIEAEDVKVRDTWGDLRFDIFGEYLVKFISQLQGRKIALFRYPIYFGPEFKRVKFTETGILFH
jgi:hypothetical protein